MVFGKILRTQKKHENLALVGRSAKRKRCRRKITLSLPSCLVL